MTTFDLDIVNNYFSGCEKLHSPIHGIQHTAEAKQKITDWLSYSTVNGFAKLPDLCLFYSLARLAASADPASTMSPHSLLTNALSSASHSSTGIKGVMIRKPSWSK